MEGPSSVEQDEWFREKFPRDILPEPFIVLPDPGMVARLTPYHLPEGTTITVMFKEFTRLILRWIAALHKVYSDPYFARMFEQGFEVEGYHKTLEEELKDYLRYWSIIAEIDSVSGSNIYVDPIEYTIAFEEEMTKFIVTVGEYAILLYSIEDVSSMPDDALSKDLNRMVVILGDISGQPRDTFVELWYRYTDSIFKCVHSALVSLDQFLEDASKCLEFAYTIGELVHVQYKVALLTGRTKSGERRKGRKKKGKGRKKKGKGKAPATKRSYGSGDKEPNLETLNGWLE